MRPLRRTVWACALVLLACDAIPARAAWCNVMQVCWNRCRKQATASYYYAQPAVVVANASPCNTCAPAPPPCTTSYVQRCYYQPVTSYTTKSYYEPVTTYQTSYYYEPVTSYRYSCYYDPCTCSYQQMACPTTSYSLKSKTDAVQSWVQKCAQVPVTTYQQSFYWEPVTSCCNGQAAPAVQAAPAQQNYIAPQAGVMYDRQSGGASVSEYPNQRNQTDAQRYNNYQNSETMPPATNSSMRQQWQPGGTVTQRPMSAPAAAPVQTPVKLRMDRVVSGKGASEVQGQVLRDDAKPWAGARIMFVNFDKKDGRQYASTDQFGSFKVDLGHGEWSVYVQGSDGKPLYQRSLNLRDDATRSVAMNGR